MSDADSGATWRGAELPQRYTDVTEQVDIKGLDLLNSDINFGNARTLFETRKPSALASAKEKSKAAKSAKRDWVESDTDEQLMLLMPFQAALGIHSIQITSLPPKTSDDGNGDDEVPMRPRTIQLYTNLPNNLGFEAAEDVPATQTITLSPQDWHEETGTAKLELRFVKFQNVTSSVMFIVDGEGSGEKVRLDRVRIIGKSGVERTWREPQIAEIFNMVSMLPIVKTPEVEHHESLAAENGHEAVVRLLLEKADGRVSPAAFTYNSVPLNPLTEAIRLLTLLPGSVPRTDIMQIVQRTAFKVPGLRSTLLLLEGSFWQSRVI